MLLHFATLYEKHVSQRILWQEDRKLALTRMSKALRSQLTNTYGSTGQDHWFVRKTRKWHKFGLVHWKLHNLSHLWVSKFNIPVQTKLKLYTLIGWHLVTFLHLRLNRKPNQNNLWNLNRNVIPLVQENLQFIWLHTSKPQRQMLFLVINVYQPSTPPPRPIGFGHIDWILRFWVYLPQEIRHSAARRWWFDDNKTHCHRRRGSSTTSLVLTCRSSSSRRPRRFQRPAADPPRLVVLAFWCWCRSTTLRTVREQTVPFLFVSPLMILDTRHWRFQSDDVDRCYRW